MAIKGELFQFETKNEVLVFQFEDNTLIKKTVGNKITTEESTIEEFIEMCEKDYHKYYTHNLSCENSQTQHLVNMLPYIITTINSHIIKDNNELISLFSDKGFKIEFTNNTWSVTKQNL